ncbi:GNAT family N-acetyltransferase [Glycomyces albidus]|uniref:GNAT family N-acetyltransferase n=1 Tax=Glycomyces albidus TaxID=2656774 RepID=A0A6L5G4T1_9ACTN|nr:GNAT family N-acetyltransferase [Glycomyces albidus]MQM24638.1 GNAT family N-acetyltransferase [Glycomyces albidus]
MTVEVTDAPERDRWEARIDGDLVGYAQYKRHDGMITFFHTVVEREGEGIGSELARTSLDAARSQGLRVHPVCPFYAGWIERHPEYKDLVHEQAPHLGEED